jgi:hypothetical protein
MTYKEALEKIATVNAMDYEYQAWAREALAKQEQEQEPVAYVHADELEELSHCNGMSVWAENALIHTDESITKQLIPSGYMPLYSKAHEDNKRIAKANYDAGYTTGYMDAN